MVKFETIVNIRQYKFDWNSKTSRFETIYKMREIDKGLSHLTSSSLKAFDSRRWRMFTNLQDLHNLPCYDQSLWESH